MVYAIPSFRGYTGLLLVPTARSLDRGMWDAGLFVESVSEGTINDYVANYGVSNGLEVGLDVFRRDDKFEGFGPTDGSKVLINGKYEFLRETAAHPAIAAGIIDLADQVESTVYVVASQSLSKKLGCFAGEPIAPTIHVGFGGGILDGVFAGLSTYLGNRIEVMVEWDSRIFDVGGRFRLTPGLTVHAGFFDVFDRYDASFGVGLSYGRYY